MTDCVGLVCEIDGAALADAAVAGVMVAPAAGVVLAVAAAGVVLTAVAGVLLAVAAAGLGVVLAAAGLEVGLVVAGVEVALDVTGGALGDAFALGAGDFIVSFLLCFGDCSFFAAGVALVAG